MKKKYLTMRRISFILVSVLFVQTVAFAADLEGNPVMTSVPSLMITPDSRASGMGDVGAATSADVNSQYWNPAKYVFNESDAGMAFSFTPWLRRLVDDINLTYLTGYWKFSDRRALSASLRYFSLGEIILYNTQGGNEGTAFPNEFAFDMAYSQKLSDNFSAAVALRLIYSDLNNGRNLAGGSEVFPGVAAAADAALYYRTPIQMSTGDAFLGLGLNLSNIGSKISYNNYSTSSFIPANLRFGLSFDYPIDEYQKFSISGDLNKLMVPTVDFSKTAENIDYYNDMSSLQGIISSFSDAPGGLKEELSEINWSVGAEYVYNNQFSLRTGYHDEDELKGNRKYFTVGGGFKMNVFELDVSYVISVAQSNPLDQTLRFTLGFDLFGLQNLMR